MMDQHFLVAWLRRRVVECHLLVPERLVVSLRGLWLQRSECVRRQATDRLHVVLDLRGNLAVPHEGPADRALAVALLILALALPLIPRGSC